MSILFTNNASGTLSSPVDGATPGPESTTLILQTNEASLFPAVTTASGNFFYATLEDVSGNIEIVKVTDRNTGTDTLTVERAQENTTSQDFAVGSKVECRPTAGTFDEFVQRSGDVITGTIDFNGQTLQNPVIAGSGVGVMKGMFIRGGDNGITNQFVVPSGGGDPTIGPHVVTHAGNDSSYVKTSFTFDGGEGIAPLGNLTSSPLTVALDLPSLGFLQGNAIEDDDRFLILDANVNTHKQIRYREAGVPIITEGGTLRVAAAADMNKYIRFTNASASTLTLNDNVGITGNVIIVEQANTGQVTINGSAQVNSAFAGLMTRIQYSVIVLLCVQGGGTAIWTMYGDAV